MKIFENSGIWGFQRVAPIIGIILPEIQSLVPSIHPNDFCGRYTVLYMQLAKVRVEDCIDTNFKMQKDDISKIQFKVLKSR